jgi:hypothetical protein
MTGEEFDALGVASQCQRPDPLICYEQQSNQQSALREGAKSHPCRSCPVASWIMAMILSGSWTDESVTVEDLAFR